MSSPGRTAEDLAIKGAAGAFRTAAWILRLFWSTPDQRLRDQLNRMLDQIFRAVSVPAVGDAIQQLRLQRFELSFCGQSDLDFKQTVEALEKDVEQDLTPLNSRSGQQSVIGPQSRKKIGSLHSFLRDCVLHRFTIRTGRQTESESSELEGQLQKKLEEAHSFPPDVVYLLKEPEDLIGNFVAVWELAESTDALRNLPVES